MNEEEKIIEETEKPKRTRRKKEVEVTPVEVKTVNVISEETQKVEVPEKKNNKDFIKILLSLVIIVLLIALLVVGTVLIFINRGETEQVSNTPDIQIQHTETAKVATEGTYIIDVSEVVENVMPSIVAITSKTLINNGYFGPFFSGQDKYATGAGSGIIINQSADEILILTNNHVIQDATELTVQFIDDETVDAKVKGTSASKDVAIVSVKTKDLKESTMKKIKLATLGDSSALKVGNGIIAIGNALGYGQSVTTGVVSAINREVKIDNNSTKMIQIDAAINGGNSGGALVNSSGEVVGINSAKYSSGGTSTSASIEGMGFAIPITDVKDLINKLSKGEKISEDEKGALGISGQMTTNSELSSYELPEGFYIVSIYEGSGAEKAGLNVGNIITEIEGEKVTSYNVISDCLSSKKAKEKVKLKVAYPSGRNFKEKEVTVTLSKYSDFN